TMNINNLPAINPPIIPLPHNHSPLQLYPQHYPILRQNLLPPIQHLTRLQTHHPLIQTSPKPYPQIPHLFIKLHQQIYNHILSKPFKPFKITNITQETTHIKSFTLQSEQYHLTQFQPPQ
ncbi:globin family protein, partial [Staphylococcus epidermidis]